MLNISSEHSFNDFKIDQRSNEIKDHAHIYHIYQIYHIKDHAFWQNWVTETYHWINNLGSTYPIFARCFISLPAENVRKPWFSDVFRRREGGGIEMEHYPKLGKRIITCSKPRIKSLEHCLILVHGQHCSKQSNHRTKHLFSSTDFFSKWNKYPVFYNLFTFSDKAFKVRLQVLPCQCQLPCSGAFIVNFK